MTNVNLIKYSSVFFSAFAIFFNVQSSFAVVTSYEFFTNNLSPKDILAEMGITKAGISSISAAIDYMEEAIGGDGVPMDRIKKANALLDGTQSLSGFNNFTVTATATRSSNTVSITGNDGSSSQTYSITYSSPIASGDTFTLTNGRKSIIFVNNSGGSITSASALTTYLVGAYPVNFVISNNISAKISALSILLAATSGGAAGTNTSIYGKTLTTILTGSISSSLGADLLASPTGDDATDLATARALLVLSLGATLQADIQTINAFLNGLGSGLTTQARIGSIFSQIDGTADYSGNIASKLTTRIQLIRSSASQLSTAIDDVADNVGGSASDLYGNIGAANSALGGSGTVIARIGSLGSASSLFSMIGATSLANLAAALGNTGSGNSAIAALLKSGSSSTSLYALIVGSSGILSQIDGTTTDSGNIAGKLTTQIQAIRSSGTQLSTAISAIATILGGTELDLYGNVGAANSALGGSGTLISRVATIYNALLASPTSVVITDLATARALLVLSLGATLQADAETLNALLNGTATGSTIEERIAAIFSQISNASSGNVTDELTTFIQAIRSSGTRLSTVISDVSNNVGGTASDLYGNVNTANTALDGVQSLSGLTSFTVTAAASNPGGNTVNIVGDDDYLSSITYSIAYSSPIASGNTFTLNTGSKSITFVNNSGGSITSAAALAAYLANAYPVSAIIKANTNTKATALKSLLGGNNYSVISNAVAIFSILGGTNSDLYSNVGAVNSSLGGSGVTTLAKIGSLGSASSLFSMIGVTSLANLTAALGNTGAGNSAIAALLNGSTGTSLYALLVGSSGILNQIDGTTTDSGNVSGKLTTQIQALNSSATQLSTAISAVNSSLGGSGTTINRTKSVNAALDGVQSLSGLTSFTVTTAATNSSGTISIMGNDGSAGRSYSVDTSVSGINLGDGTGGTTAIANGSTVTLTHAGSGNTITFVNNSGSSITSASSLATYLANAYPVSAIIKASTSTKTTALKALLGGNNYSAMSNAAAVFAILGGTNSDIYSNMNAANSSLGGDGTIIERIGNPTQGSSASNLAAIIGGTSTDLATQVGDPGADKTIISNIGGSTTNIQEALNALATILLNNTSFSSSLYTQASSMSTTLDNGLNSLPNGNTSATIGSAAASDGSGGVNITMSGLGSANGTYNLPAATITGNIANGSTFTLTNGSNNIVLYNRSGATINTQAKALSYLSSMYPATSQIATGVSDKISNGLNKMLGGSATSIRARIAAIDAILLTNPTGVIATDLATARALLVTSLGATFQADVEALNSLLNGTASGSTTQARIVNILSQIDGDTSGDVADKLIAQIQEIQSDATQLSTAISTVRTAIDGSSGAVVSGTGGSDFGFTSYSGTTSQVFADENITVSSNTITVKIGSDSYTYSASTSAINNGNTITFTGPSGESLVLIYTGGGINNDNASANANDLQVALNNFFQTGSSITPGNLSSKVAALGESIDGATSSNLMMGLANLGTVIDGSSSFSIAGTTGADFVVPAYDGATSQVFGADAFSNGGTTTISVTIGTDTYTYDNTDVTNIGGYGTIRFTNGSKSLIIQNNTGAPITAGTDQNTADSIVTALNTYFGNGSKLNAANLSAKIGNPTLNGTASNLAAVLGGPGSDIASLVGDPVTANGGISGLINAPNASNDHGVFSDLSGFQSATNIHDQFNAFFDLFASGSVTFDFSGGAPTSLADFVSRAVSRGLSEA